MLVINVLFSQEVYFCLPLSFINCAVGL